MNSPKSENAKQAFDLLVRHDRPFPGYVYPSDIDRESLRELLIAVTCPIPCDGFGDEGSWHNTCVKRADAALETLEALGRFGDL